jgi:fatty acid desaturase
MPPPQSPSGDIHHTDDSGLCPAQPALILREIADMWDFARQTGIAKDLKALHRPRLSRSLLAAAGDWALIAIATAATIALGWAAVPFSLLVIGNRQRALGNILHDASHRSFSGNRRRSAILANLLFCWPLWVSMAIYRNEHNRHHRFLGDPAQDPDFIHDETRLSRGWLSVWLDQMLSPRMIRISILSHLMRMNSVSLIGVVCWWAAMLSLIAFASSATDALVFLALWVAARATVFHVITSFREISDHVGLLPGGLIGFSRNHPFSSAVGQVFHPHNNGYHLLHHLMPGLPFHAMPRAHALLLDWPPYATGEQCESYFLGENSAVRSWVRHWEPDSATSA